MGARGGFPSLPACQVNSAGSMVDTDVEPDSKPLGKELLLPFSM